MKLALVAILAAPALARLQLNAHHNLGHQVQKFQADMKSKPTNGVHYGDSRCPCIGFDNIDGESILAVKHDGEDVEISYPADMGSRCEAWDDNRYPKCKAGAKPGEGEGWCAQPWCYVDSCNCDIDVLPKMSELYNAEATFRGKPLFWSYATCGGKDVFTKKVPELGRPQCRCIGFAGLAGSTEIAFKDGVKADYPADMGTSCSAWDLDRHPACLGGDDVPHWCKSRWCYVDPCDCQLPGETVPKISAYLPDATFTGKNLYYSYETCGSADTWTEKNHGTACVNQDTEDACGRLSRCRWTGSRCLGAELVDHPLCKEAGAALVKKLGGSKSGAGLVSPGLVTVIIAAVAGHYA